MATARREPLAKPAEVAEYLGVDIPTLRNWRSRRQGPPWLKLNPHEVRYRWPEVDAWLEQQQQQEGEMPAQPKPRARRNLRTA